MTYADPALMKARNYLIGLGIPGNEIGIVGDESHRSSGGYHVGNDVLAMIGKLHSDYSKRQTEKDRPGSNAAMALDIGGLSGQQLSDLTNWLIAQCRAGTSDTRNIREVIGRKSPSGGIQHYDALGIQTGLPAGHDTHTHISYYRDSEGGDKTSLFRRYFEGGSTSAPANPEGDEEGMKIIIANLTGRATLWSGLRGVVPLIAHSHEAAVEALDAAGAVRCTFPDPAALVEATGPIEGTTVADSIAAVNRAG